MGRRVLKSKFSVSRLSAALGLVLLIGAPGARAQSGSDHPQDQKPQAANPADVSRDNQRKADEFTEASQALSGGPAGNPECVWLGRRVVQLMYNDDLDTAFRHLDLYDRFGCPGGHVQAAFRCLTRFIPQIDPKVPNSLNNHVHTCWINPDAKPQVAAAPAPGPASSPAATPAAQASPAPTQQPAPQASPSPAQPPAK
ncbi:MULTISPECIES: beta-1-3, beta-1-6-glucan biosynthesis protein [unclassified Bradyrhizobium]|uniref:beta-1-3, beta-1-6-glucan biosynthesis protein n=1 Tax=unclassified Bradyrhizobium TaxID=2631580 RepID=UPI0028E84B5A|nr:MULTISPECIES: beta-1-3, beta-1-6-glucan biosynthesis protein [unclassified Bradyrhizobium]